MGEIIKGLALVLYPDGDIGCNVCGHFCDQTIECVCLCHEYPDDADFVVEDYEKTLQYTKQLQGYGFNYMRRAYHDIESNMSEITRGSKMTCHLIDERDKCIFCGKVDPHSIRPFLELLGPGPEL